MRNMRVRKRKWVRRGHRESETKRKGGRRECPYPTEHYARSIKKLFDGYTAGFTRSRSDLSGETSCYRSLRRFPMPNT